MVGEAARLLSQFSDKRSSHIRNICSFFGLLRRLFEQLFHARKELAFWVRRRFVCRRLLCFWKSVNKSLSTWSSGFIRQRIVEIYLLSLTREELLRLFVPRSAFNSHSETWLYRCLPDVLSTRVTLSVSSTTSFSVSFVIISSVRKKQCFLKLLFHIMLQWIRQKRGKNVFKTQEDTSKRIRNQEVSESNWDVLCLSCHVSSLAVLKTLFPAIKEETNRSKIRWRKRCLWQTDILEMKTRKGEEKYPDKLRNNELCEAKHFNMYSVFFISFSVK